MLHNIEDALGLMESRIQALDTAKRAYMAALNDVEESGERLEATQRNEFLWNEDAMTFVLYGPGGAEAKRTSNEDERKQRRADWMARYHQDKLDSLAAALRAKREAEADVDYYHHLSTLARLNVEALVNKVTQ